MGYDPDLRPYRVWDLVDDKDYGKTTGFTQKWTGLRKAQTGWTCLQLKEKSRTTLEAYYAEDELAPALLPTP